MAALLLAHGLTQALEPRKKEIVPLAPGEDLSSREFYRPELSVTLGNVAVPLPEALAAVVGPGAQLFVDPRSGVPTNVLAAIPMVPGAGVGNGLTLEGVGTSLGRNLTVIDAPAVAELVRRFVVTNAPALHLDAAQVGTSQAAQVTPGLWHVRIPQVAGGIPVRYAHLAATINNGNMVLLGTEMWGSVGISTRPQITSAQALEAGFAYAGGRSALDVLYSDAHLEIIPTAPGGDEGAYGHVLAWVFGFKRGTEIESWEVIVDAQSGDVVSFQDTNQYESRKIQGGAYPLTNTGICPANTTCGAMQAGEPMPYADTGFPAPNNFTDAAGVYDYTAGSATTQLNGRFVRMTDTCGPISFGSSTGNIDLEGTNGQHDCTSAGGSAGNTAATRSGYYELNKLIEMAKGWLPFNNWLNQKLTSNMNIVDVCNAFYSTGDGTINFFRSGGGCRNTGEIAAVFDHEWGHALDDNDSAGQLSSSSEAYGDITAIYRLRSSCVGYGFFQTANKGCGMTADGTGFNQNESLLGTYCDTNCSGVRDADWAGHVSNQPATALGFVCTHCSGGSGPCGRQVHCSAAPSRQAAWDLVTRDLTAAPFNMSREDAFNLGAKIFFQGSGAISSWHGCQCGVSSNGCGATNAYMQWLSADDDDGNVANGTPHMTAIYNAFNRHGIACSTPTPVNGGCAGGPAAAPTVTAQSTVSNQIQVSWTAVPNANRYRVLRTEGFAGCDFGKALVFEGNALTYTDNDVADDRTYYYVVQAIGTAANGACMGPGSTCTAATPVSCAGRLSSDRSAYGCSDTIQLRVTDADLRNAGPQTVAVTSTTEPTGELVTLNETPAGSGVFRGTIPTSAAPTAGAGVLKVANGGQASFSFVDASACGTLNVPLQKTAAINCTGEPCIGAITLNKATFNCSDQVQITLVDTDLTGTGSRTVDVSSTVESTPESITLFETPANSGRFVGTVSTSSAAPSPNGILNVAQGSTMTIRYQDASACGVANVQAQKTAPIDCTGQPCTGTLQADKTVYTCSDTMQVTLIDSDLVGQPTKTIQVSSTLESTPEPLVLTEAGGGMFIGQIPTTSLPATADGRISGGDGTVITLAYQDASACGIPNVTAQRTATLDCAPPIISNVRAEGITGSTADLKWTTNEPSSSFITYGTTVPPANAPPGAVALVTAHSVHLTGLPECGRVFFSVGSTDNLSQTSVANNGGEYFSFNVGTEAPQWFASPNLPVTFPDTSPFPNTTSFTLDDDRTIVDVNVRLNIAHTSIGQLIVSLRHPDGTFLILSNHRGGGGDNFVNTVFDDEAGTAISAGTAPFTGSYRPEALLSLLDGKSVDGTWTLEVLDNVTGQAATINGFEIEITLGQPCAPPEVLQLVWTDKTTLTWTADAVTSTYTLHRGTGADLPSLLTGSTDSCVRATTSSTTVTGLADVPPVDGLQWYLVTGTNASGLGSAGSSSSGPRLLDSTGTCP